MNNLSMETRGVLTFAALILVTCFLVSITDGMSQEIVSLAKGVFILTAVFIGVYFGVLIVFLRTRSNRRKG